MYRYKIIIEYDGSNYIGWQKQKSSFLSIEECVNKAFSILCNYPVSVFGAGRTDSGVHAIGQVAHVDLKEYWPECNIIEGVNFYLRPHRIVLVSVSKTSNLFNARFSATKRHYIYRLVNRASRLSINMSYVWHISIPLDFQLMVKGAYFFTLINDFSSFRSKYCQSASSFKKISDITLVKVNDEIKFFVSANSFLHNQIRNIVGTLVLLGRHKISLHQIKDIVKSKDRSFAGPTAPACGLYLNRIEYPIITNYISS
jgi:tRNA pseudouridine38-40 synthase